jgi:hypothetical protein
MMTQGQPHPNVNATIHRYLTDKVREKYSEDYHLIEPLMEQLVKRYSLKELYMICALEISKVRNGERRVSGGRSSGQ